MINRSSTKSLALETTLLAHGVPRHAAHDLATSINRVVREHGADPALVGVLDGAPIVGMNDEELTRLLDAGDVRKANTANVGAIMHAGSHGATTVSTTIELAAEAGVRVFATGGLGGVHKRYAEHLDISSDLTALSRFPVAVVASGVKSILDIDATREALETLGVPVIGYRTDRFPAFYFRESGAGVDARFDDIDDLAAFIRAELERTGRGILVVNPIPSEHEPSAELWTHWLAAATQRVAEAGVTGRDTTPALLAALHDVSDGATLAANIELVKNNARVGAMIAAR